MLLRLFLICFEGHELISILYFQVSPSKNKVDYYYNYYYNYNLDCGQDRFQPIKLLNLFVSSPFETWPFLIIGIIPRLIGIVFTLLNFVAP